MRIGSLFTGYGGLTMATEQVFGGRTVWTSDIDPGACKIIAHRYPGVPNLGDITKIDWPSVQPIDLLDAGWPCQPFSHAGKRLGAADERALWPEVARAVRALRPRHVVLENVAAVASAGELARAVADLAALGYVGSWRCLRAADVGAPHGRARIFILATDARHAAGRRPDSVSRGVGRRFASDEPVRFATAAADTQRSGWDGRAGQLGPGRRAEPADSSSGTAPDTPSDGRHQGRLVGGPDAAQRGDAPVADPERLGESGRGELRDLGGPPPDSPSEGLQRQRDRHAADHRGPVAWGAYEPAIRRWERVLGRPAPAPTEDSPEWHAARRRRLSGQHKVPAGMRGSLRRFLGPVPQRLSPAFVEWMMGLPAGWVTDVPGLGRNAQLKALGNGVVPQQAAAALRLMLDQLAVTA